ncbi:hypothetical protein [Desulfovibrio psychrotolerans]|uniref:DZANK-type domain-containing protein n=1 Tax=Desulfovibrio psychrotolerans TaxID=415242 RepID=A0A7J0BW64_9BACT|nr:hypothetical protein [Desulfovibrio psychrotolerans]GFM37966.1 hypothetical protein DSM19430T_26500 [Desulfovibrio psychrotolerans]
MEKDTTPKGILEDIEVGMTAKVKIVFPETKLCPSCKMEIEEDNYHYCPRCREDLTPLFTFRCPLCGFHTLRELGADDHGCPMCGTPIHNTASATPRCGAQEPTATGDTGDTDEDASADEKEAARKRRNELADAIDALVGDASWQLLVAATAIVINRRSARDGVLIQFSRTCVLSGGWIE